MAREFTKNTANYIDLPNNSYSPRVVGASAISINAWVYPRSVTGTGSDNRVINAVIDGGNLTGFMIGLFNSSGLAKIRVGGRSVGTDSFQRLDGPTTVPFNTWSNIGAVLDYANDQERVYFNGALDASAAKVFGNTTYTQNSAPTVGDAIGSSTSPPGGTAEQFDGYIAELAVWAGDIGDTGMYQLARRFAPKLVRFNLARVYFPLIGRSNPERDIVGGLTGNITGSIPDAPHPPIIRV